MHLEVGIPSGDLTLYGHLALPSDLKGWVVFAHGAGSSRKSPRNNWVANRLNERGFGTLLFDLLTPDEDRVFQNRFDIQRLGSRLLDATRWLMKSPYYHHRPIGFFGASTGAAAALEAAAHAGRDIPLYAIVSRGGRPDLAQVETLANLRLPTLMIVGGEDREVIALNQRAKDRLPQARLVLVPGATHLFEEPGTLEEVERLAAQWFTENLQIWYQPHPDHPELENL